VSLDSICISSASKNHACDIIGVQYILLNFTIRGENFLISYFSLLRPMLKVLALTFYFLVDKDEGGSLCLICKVFLKDLFFPKKCWFPLHFRSVVSQRRCDFVS